MQLKSHLNNQDVAKSVSLLALNKLGGQDFLVKMRKLKATGIPTPPQYKSKVFTKSVNMQISISFSAFSFEAIAGTDHPINPVLGKCLPWGSSDFDPEHPSLAALDAHADKNNAHFETLVMDKIFVPLIVGYSSKAAAVLQVSRYCLDKFENLPLDLELSAAASVVTRRSPRLRSFG